MPMAKKGLKPVEMHMVRQKGRMLPGKKGSYHREQRKGSLGVRPSKTVSNSLCLGDPTVKDFKNMEIMRQEILGLLEASRKRKS